MRLDGIHAALVGRLGADAALRFTQAGVPMLRASVAVLDPHTQAAQWLSVIHFGQDAESLAEQLTRGCAIYAEGQLRLASWQAADGREQSGLNLYATRLEPLASFAELRRPTRRRSRAS